MPVPTLQAFAVNLLIIRTILNSMMGLNPAPNTPELIAPGLFSWGLWSGMLGAIPPIPPGAVAPAANPARQAAEMISLMVSDHLPVMFWMAL